MSTSRDPAPIILVDWDADDDFADTYDDLSGRLLQATLRVERGRDTAQILAPAAVPSGEAEFLNADGLLSPENAGSPLAGLVEPGLGQPASFSAYAGDQPEIEYDEVIDYDAAVDYDGPVFYNLLLGVLDDLNDNVDGQVHTATLAVLGSTARLSGGASISTPLYANILVSDAIGHVLDAAGWPADRRSIATSDTTLLYWWLDDADPFEALSDLVATEGAPAAWFESGNGNVVFQNRTWRVTQSRSISPQARILDSRDDAEESDLFHDGVELSPGFRDVKNKATMTVVRRAVGSTQKVWEYGETLVLAPNETRDITVPLSDPCQDAIAPAAATDYTVSVGSLASSPTLVTQYAQKIVIRFVASGSGATLLGVTSDGPQLRAKPVTVVSSEVVTSTYDASASITKRGERVLKLDQETNARQDLNRASALAVLNAAVELLQAPPSTVEVVIPPIDQQHIAHMMTTEVSDRLAVTSVPRGMRDAHVWVEQVRHERQPQGWYGTFICSRATSTAYNFGLWGPGDNAGVWGLSVWIN